MFALINSLRESHYKTALLSDQTNEWWPFLNQKYAISSYFDECIISSEVGHHKPEPEIYHIALQKLHSQPHASVFIDDLTHNLTPADDIGISTILYIDTTQLRKELITLNIQV